MQEVLDATQTADLRPDALDQPGGARVDAALPPPPHVAPQPADWSATVSSGGA